MVLARFVEAALQGRTLIVHGDGRQSRCFCHVADVITALTQAMNSRACEGEVINIGSGDEVSIADLARRVVAAAGSKSKIEYLAYDQAFPDGGFEDMRRRVPCLDKAKRLLNWTPSNDMDKIIADTISDCRTRLHISG
jgi:UDP-glucose 4-epimerase